MKEFHLGKRLVVCWFGFDNFKFKFNNLRFAMWLDVGPLQIAWLKVVR